MSIEYIYKKQKYCFIIFFRRNVSSSLLINYAAVLRVVEINHRLDLAELTSFLAYYLMYRMSR